MSEYLKGTFVLPQLSMRPNRKKKSLPVFKPLLQIGRSYRTKSSKNPGIAKIDPSPLPPSWKCQDFEKCWYDNSSLSLKCSAFWNALYGLKGKPITQFPLQPCYAVFTFSQRWVTLSQPFREEYKKKVQKMWNTWIMYHFGQPSRPLGKSSPFL